MFQGSLRSSASEQHKKPVSKYMQRETHLVAFASESHQQQRKDGSTWAPHGGAASSIGSIGRFHDGRVRVRSSATMTRHSAPMAQAALRKSQEGVGHRTSRDPEFPSRSLKSVCECIRLLGSSDVFFLPDTKTVIFSNIIQFSNFPHTNWVSYNPILP